MGEETQRRTDLAMTLKKVYRNLPTADRLKNPDNYMEFAP